MKYLTILAVAMLCACTPPAKDITSENTDLYRVDYDGYDIYENLGYCDVPCEANMQICYERKDGKCQPKINTAQNSI